jgi:hypothetical protein
MALASTQPLTQMSTRSLPRGTGLSACKADNLTAICEPTVLRNVGASTSHNPMGLPGLIRDSFTFSFSFFWLKGLMGVECPMAEVKLILHPLPEDKATLRHAGTLTDWACPWKPHVVVHTDMRDSSHARSARALP